MTSTSKILQAHEEAKSYQRIKSKNLIGTIFTDFTPWNKLSGFQSFLYAPSGRKIEFVNDPAVIVGTAVFKGTAERVAIIAQQTPSDDAERTKLNYGMVKADGYGISLCMMNYAERNRIKLFTFIDTVGGDPYEYSAEKLQSWLISYCQSKMMSLRTKTISTVLGLGGSGGAIAIQLGHRRLMLSRAEYSVITAEGCSAILFRSAEKVAEALEVLQPTAAHMKKYGIIDEIVKEPALGKSSYISSTLKTLQESLAETSRELDLHDVRHLRQELRRKIERCGRTKREKQIYTGITKKIKAWLPNYFSGAKQTEDISQMQIALYGAEPYFCNDEKDGQGKIIRSGCKSQLTKTELHANNSTCPCCGRPETLSSDDYLEFLLDEASFHEIEPDLCLEDVDPTYNFFNYSASVKKLAGKTDSKDSLVTGYGTMFGIPVAVAVCDFRFMGGSMSSVFGEKMNIIVNYCIEKKLPLVTVTVSGGARMQEGTVALYQMAKTISAITKLRENGLPNISILGHPTTGGALASYSVQGDFLIAEKKAVIAFAGDRVVKLTSGGRGVDPKIMSSEFYEKYGGVHLVAERRQIKPVITGLLQLRGFKNITGSVGLHEQNTNVFNEDWL